MDMDNLFTNDSESKNPLGVMTVLSSHNDPKSYMGQTYTPHHKKKKNQNESMAQDEDAVLISEAAKKAYQLGQDSGDKVLEPNGSSGRLTVDSNDLHQIADEMLHSFKTRFLRSMKMGDIPNEEPFWLYLDSDGNFKIAGSDRDTEAINAIFHADTGLLSEWKTVMALCGLHKQLSDFKPFWSLYQKEPNIALSRYFFQSPESHQSGPMMRIHKDSIQLILKNFIMPQN